LFFFFRVLEQIPHWFVRMSFRIHVGSCSIFVWPRRL
jgi:hypothetical protein